MASLNQGRLHRRLLPLVRLGLTMVPRTTRVPPRLRKICLLHTANPPKLLRKLLLSLPLSMVLFNSSSHLNSQGARQPSLSINMVNRLACLKPNKLLYKPLNSANRPNSHYNHPFRLSSRLNRFPAKPHGTVSPRLAMGPRDTCPPATFSRPCPSNVNRYRNNTNKRPVPQRTDTRASMRNPKEIRCRPYSRLIRTLRLRRTGCVS